MDNVHKKAATIMGVLALLMAAIIYFLAFRGGDPVGTLGLDKIVGNPMLVWPLAVVIPLAYAAFFARDPVVREWLAKPHWLKLVALVLAIMTAVLEEILFRGLGFRLAVDAGAGPVIQILVTGIAFGLAQMLWGMTRGGNSLSRGSIAANMALGLALSLLYWLSDYHLAPSILANFLARLLVEPGLILSAFVCQIGARR